MKGNVDLNRTIVQFSCRTITFGSQKKDGTRIKIGTIVKFEKPESYSITKIGNLAIRYSTGVYHYSATSSLARGQLPNEQ